MNGFWTNLVVNQALTVLAALMTDPKGEVARKVRPVIVQIQARSAELLRLIPQ